MEGRTPTFLMLVLCDCTDEAQLDDLNRWYNQQHLDEVCAAGTFGNAVRYEAAGQTTSDPAPRFLTTYDALTAEPEVAYAELAEAMKEVCFHPALRVRRAGLLERVGVYTAPQKLTANGLMVGVTSCNDPEAFDSFQRWYDTVHAADVVRSRIFWGRQRYATTSSGNLEGGYYAFYESEQAEPEASSAYLNWPDRDSSMHDALQLHHVWHYNRIYSQQEAR